MIFQLLLNFANLVYLLKLVALRYCSQKYKCEFPAQSEFCIGSVSQMEKKRQKEVEMQRLEQIREEFKKKTEGLLQFKGQ